jgi:hypothetical protein
MGRPKGEPTRTLSLRLKLSTLEKANERHGRKLNALMADYIEFLSKGGAPVRSDLQAAKPTPSEAYAAWKQRGHCNVVELAAHFNISPQEATDLIRRVHETHIRERETTYPTI